MNGRWKVFVMTISVSLIAWIGASCGLVDAPSDVSSEVDDSESAETQGAPAPGSDGSSESSDDVDDGAEHSDSAAESGDRPDLGDDFRLGEGTGDGDWKMPEDFDAGRYDGMEAIRSHSTTVSDAVRTSCTTTSVRGLARQLVDQINCYERGEMRSIAGIGGVSLGGAVLPYLQKPAVRSLKLAENERRTAMRVNSALRTLAGQYVLRRWDRQNRCGIPIAATPGTSNHESGLAVDLQNYGTFRAPMERHGFRWFGSGDEVHFDYVSGGTDIRELSVRAFQQLWNENHPEDQIAVDGQWGPATASRMRQAPASGFSSGATCESGAEQPSNDYEALEVYWHRTADGSYKLRALASSEVERVQYFVDGYQIGEATRSDGSNFPDRYRFRKSERERKFVVWGYDSSDERVAKGVGLLDVRSDWGAYIKQMGDHLYEIGLERAPDGVAAIEVRVDGYLLEDGPTDMTRSPRNAVRSYINNLGERDFKITTFAADGSVRGHIRRTFKLE